MDATTRAAVDAATLAERARICAERGIAPPATDARQRATAIVDDAIARGRGDNRVVGPANAEARAAAITSALLHRHDPDKHPLSASGQSFRGMSLLAIARDCLEVNGIRTAGMDRMEIARTALNGATRAGGMMSTSDFPNILANLANKTLRDAYKAAPQTFRPIVRETSVINFKPVSREQMSEAPKLERIGEHGEYHRGTLGEAREQYAIATFGRIVAITRQVIINDDVSAFTRLPAMFGTQAANLESDLVWGAILGPRPMGDGLPVFHATHKNIGVPIALGEIGLGGGRAAMRKQTGLDGKTFLHIAARYLIVPATLETLAEQLTAMITPTKADDVIPQAIRSLQAVTEARLDLGFTDPATGDYIAPSDTAWYLAATPGAVDTVELAYLDGQSGVYTEIKNGFDVDGVEIKVRLDAGAKVIDHRGFYKNAGAPA